MTDSIVEAPAPWARLGGLFYLGTIATGVFAWMFVRSALIVRGDAAATAHNILGAESLFRLGIATELLGIMCYVAVTAIFYDLFKPVSRRLSLLAACFSLVGCAVGAVDLIDGLGALVVLHNPQFLSAFTAEQSRGLAYLFLNLQGQGNTIGLLFFGVYCTLIGSLILRSAFMPRIVGALMLLAGFSWLLGNLAGILSLALGSALFFTTLGGIGGEAALTLWLLLFGVDVAKWRRQAGGHA